jgi:hypothetical protein
MARTKTFVPVTRADLAVLTNTGVLGVEIVERHSKKKKNPDGSPKIRKARRYIVPEGKSILDVVAGLDEAVTKRCLMDGLNREIYFHSGSGAKARAAKQLETAVAKLALAQKVAAAADSDE